MVFADKTWFEILVSRKIIARIPDRNGDLLHLLHFYYILITFLLHLYYILLHFYYILLHYGSCIVCVILSEVIQIRCCITYADRYSVC